MNTDSSIPRFKKALYNKCLFGSVLNFHEKGDYFTTLILSIPIFLKDDSLLFKLESNNITVIINKSLSINIDNHAWKFAYEKTKV